MEDYNFEYDFSGAPVVYSNLPKPPHNPLNRPTISYKKFVVALIGLPVTILISLMSYEFFLNDIVCQLFNLNKKQGAWLIAIAFSSAYIMAVLKRGLIWLVHLYQHYAPDEMRLRCVFEPSCSEYMILSIKKYGSLIGVLKGIHRLIRCHPPNGGHDEP